MATSYKYDCCSSVWTYGAELELIDWPRAAVLPAGMAVDDGNWTTVNSNGVAADGPGKLYHLGGEILTAPSEDVNGPAEQLEWIQNKWPEATHNYRTGLNVHVRVPGLRDNLRKLKQLQGFVHRVMPTLLPILDPILIPSKDVYVDKADFRGAQRNYRTRRKDHYTLLSDRRLKLQIKARTPREFFEAEAIHERTGEVHWALAARTCVNLRQMLQTDTIEFRHFFMPYTAEELFNTTLWCKLFLEAAFDGGSITPKQLLDDFGFENRKLPTCLPYDPWLDRGFYFTSRHYNSPEQVLVNIKRWLSTNGKV